MKKMKKLSMNDEQNYLQEFGFYSWETSFVISDLILTGAGRDKVVGWCLMMSDDAILSPIEHSGKFSTSPRLRSRRSYRVTSRRVLRDTRHCQSGDKGGKPGAGDNWIENCDGERQYNVILGTRPQETNPRKVSHSWFSLMQKKWVQIKLFIDCMYKWSLTRT